MTNDSIGVAINVTAGRDKKEKNKSRENTFTVLMEFILKLSAAVISRLEERSSCSLIKIDKTYKHLGDRLALRSRVRDFAKLIKTNRK